MKQLDIPCIGYSVKADLYDSYGKGPVMLTLIGRTSNRKKQHYIDFSNRLANEQGITTLIFDYSGHGDSPFEFADLRPAQHFLEVITAFDWLTMNYPNRQVIVMGSSYGGYMATQLTKYRVFDYLLLRAPAIYRPVDFYTRAGDEDIAATNSFRKDVAALAKHPLLARASSYHGKTLLIIHENDEVIHTPTTDAYVHAFQPEVIVEKSIKHSLDYATPEQVTTYFNDIFRWLETAVVAE